MRRETGFGTRADPRPFWRCVLLSAAILFLAAPQFALAGDRVALVVGNSDYRNTSPLRNPRNDAALMARTLEALGFTVTLATDQGYLEMKRALLEFGRVLREPGLEAGLFFYAGHGVQVRGENYLVPVDATIDSEDEIDLEAINVNDFLQVMNSSQSGINIVILDACRNNPFARSFRSASRGLAPVQAPKGTLIAYSTAPGDVALDGDGDNSPYTLALTTAMRAGAGAPIETVFKSARKTVVTETADRQVPWETTSIIGDFYFGGAAATLTAPPVAPAPAPVQADSRLDAFDAARRAGTTEGWETYLRIYGDQDEFYASLARDALAALTPPKPRALVDRNRFGACVPAEFGAGRGQLCATSTLAPQSGNRYDPGRLTDGQDRTAWVEGTAGDGVGEALLFEPESPRRISTLRVMNGYAKSADIWRKNGRVRDLVIETSNGVAQRVTLEDRDGWQTITLKDDRPVAWVTFSISSAYSGAKYTDTAISELRLD